MKKLVVPALVLASAVLSLTASLAFAQPEVQHGNRHEPPAFVHWSREYANLARSGSVNMTWHNGQIMPTAATAAIFWGKSWSNSTFVGDKITGLDKWYQGVGSSSYAATVNEYTGTNGQVTSTITYSGYVVDATAAPTGAPQTSAILSEVCKVIPNPVSNGYYAVYVDTPRGNTGYCAWHSYGTCGSTPVQFAFFFSLDGDPGCDPQDSSGLHSQGLAALANVSGHELSEARSDPRNGGWYDSRGNENGDKCAWTFGSSSLSFADGTQWKIQGNWSNKAYTARTGYANSSGQNGCVDGGSYK
jgi:hypothetical protein